MKNGITRLNLLRALIFTSCLFNGLLAGGNVYRYIVEVPAWQHLNAVNWAEYSHYADLGNGLFLFPVEAIIPFILLTIASAIITRNKTLHGSVTLTIYSSTLLALLGIVFTFFAAPIMLGLKTGNSTPTQLQAIFNQFHFWGRLRAIAQILSFFTNVTALARVYSR